MRIIKEWAGWQLAYDGYVYFLYRPSDPAWFRPLEVKTDEDALNKAKQIASEEEKNPGPPIQWEKQSHSKEDCFGMALIVREELLKRGEEPGSLRELVALVCKINWMV